MVLKKIISGGQTGVDHAALDAALSAGFPCGGYCPKGRESEDGIIDSKYPLEEIEGGYRQRTLMNLKASDATLIIYNSEVTGGTELTLASCIKHHKHYKLIDMSLVSVDQAKEALENFIDKEKIEILNVAGSRLSSEPKIYSYTRNILEGIL